MIFLNLFSWMISTLSILILSTHSSIIKKQRVWIFIYIHQQNKQFSKHFTVKTVFSYEKINLEDTTLKWDKKI